ncbi:hypothetical protein HID58_088141, partial [Brassica napus]
ERKRFGFGSPDLLRPSCFRSSGCRLWEEEISPVLLRRLLFPGSVCFAFSWSFSRLCPIKALCASFAQLTLESRSCDSIDVDLTTLVVLTVVGFQAVKEDELDAVLNLFSGSFDGSRGDLEIVSMKLSVEESRRNRWVRWSQTPACSGETIGGFVFAGDVFSVSVTVM